MESFNHLEKLLAHLRLVSQKITRGLLHGDYQAAFKGVGLEFDQLRQYDLGDDIRMIDWNSFARTNELMIRKFIQERDRTVFVALDCSASMFCGGQSMLKVDYAKQVAACLAYISGISKDRIGFLTFSDKINKFVPPARGQSHLAKILEAIQTISYQEGVSTNFYNLVKQLSTVQHRKGAVLFIVSDWLVDEKERLSDIVRQLSIEYDFIPCFIKDLVEEKMPDIGLIKVYDPEAKTSGYVDTRSRFFQEALKERSDAVINAFARHKIESISFLTSQEPVHTLASFFHRRTKRQV